MEAIEAQETPRAIKDPPPAPKAGLTPKQEKYRSDLLKKIHTHPQYKIKKENDAWQDFLFLAFGADSCAALGLAELADLLEYLDDDRRELRPNEENRYYTCPSSEYYMPDPTIEERRKEVEEQKQKEEAEAKYAAKVALMSRLWSEAPFKDKSDDAMRRFIFKQTGELLLHLNQPSEACAAKVIRALQAILHAKKRRK
jgi:hypothetical protein